MIDRPETILPAQTSAKRLIRTLHGETAKRPPFWFMRQAGRYLPEYLKVRAQAGDFLSLCYTPELAIEVTLQPIRRFHMDAAILFSDILVVPDALGQPLAYKEGEGPVLEPVRNADDLKKLDLGRLHGRLEPVYETVRGLRRELPTEVALIGFAGAPWTVASYMVEGRGSRDFAVIKDWAYRDSEGFAVLIDLLIEATAQYLIAQADAGAEALQIFDTWAGALSENQFRKWALEPVAQIVTRVRARHPEIPIIGFPRGVGASYLTYVHETGLNAISLDTSVPLRWAADELQPHVTVQGNLDPLLVVAGGAEMRREAERLLETLGKGPFIFNLGHGFTPQTPPEHVAELSNLIRDW